MYILDKVLYQIFFFCRYFLPLCGLFSGFLDRAKVFNCNEVQFINSFFRGLYLRCFSSRVISIPASFSPVLSSRSFIVVYFTLRSVIHFELVFFALIFVSGVRSVSRFITLHVNVHHFSKRLSFALLCCLSSLEKQQLTIFMWLCSGLCMLFHSFTCSSADTTLT